MPEPIPIDQSRLGEIRARGVPVPEYDRDTITTGVVHFGVGGFHRSHQAMYFDRLMNGGLGSEWGITGVGLLPADRHMREVMRAQDCLYLMVERSPEGTSQARVIGSIVDYLHADTDSAAIVDILTAPTTRMVTLTITEAGYNVHRVTGKFLDHNPAVTREIDAGTGRSVFAFVTEGLARRRRLGIPPFAIVSCDNLDHNGDVARTAFTGYAALRDRELASWIHSDVKFPSSMVDRITPTTTAADVADVLERWGIADGWPVVCEPFVQWVIEDDLPESRPPLEAVGVQVVKDVEPFELMKLRLLNGGHQALGYAAALAGHTFVHEGVADPALHRFLRGYMNEAAQTLPFVPDTDISAYCDNLVARFGNVSIADTVARICLDGSERMPKFVLPILQNGLDVAQLPLTIAVVACWARYCRGFDDDGRPIELVDPEADRIAGLAQRDDDGLSFLRDRDIFGPLAENPALVETYQRISRSLGSRGVRSTLIELTSA